MPCTLVAVQVCTSAELRVSVRGESSAAGKSPPQAPAKKNNPDRTTLRARRQEFARTACGFAGQSFIEHSLPSPRLLLGWEPMHQPGFSVITLCIDSALVSLPISIRRGFVDGPRVTSVLPRRRIRGWSEHLAASSCRFAARPAVGGRATCSPSIRKEFVRESSELDCAFDNHSRFFTARTFSSTVFLLGPSCRQSTRRSPRPRRTAMQVNL